MTFQQFYFLIAFVVGFTIFLVSRKGYIASVVLGFMGGLVWPVCVAVFIAERIRRID